MKGTATFLTIISEIPNVGWFVIAFIALLIFILLMSKGTKLKFGSKTVEIDSGNGEKLDVDLLGLMYIMSDECHRIEQKQKATIDDIIPDLSYKLTTLSNVACLNLRVESILNSRRRKNGFEYLLDENSIEKYIKAVAEEISIKLGIEEKNTIVCTNLKIQQIRTEDIQSIARTFTIKAIRACQVEYQEKIALYTKFLPLYKSVNDENRISFCEAKIKKHSKQVDILSSILDKYRDI